MRFCPKCSLKIKANIAQCPICKVELLSCADDEEHGSQSAQPQQGDQTVNKGPSTPSPETTVSTTGVKSQADATPSPAAPSASGDEELVQKVEQLGTQLTAIEKNLALVIGKDTVIKKSIVDLEAKLNKLEKQVVQQATFPLDRLETLEKEVAKKTSHTTPSPSSDLHASDPNPPTRGNIQTLRSLAGKMSPQGFSSDDHTFSEGGTSFTKDESDDFSTSFQSSDSSLELDDSAKVQSEGKKKVPLLIPLIALALIAIWLGFYYAKPQKQQIQTEIITEEFTPIPSSQTTPPHTEEPLLPANETKDTLIPVIETPQVDPVHEKEPVLPQTPPPAVTSVSDKPPRYTINVGSFKDKKLATSLTTRLRDNGYTALMSQSGPNDFYRVKVGAFPTIEEARSYASLLKKKEKLDTFVTSIDQP